jgi:hypothetical protein
MTQQGFHPFLAIGSVLRVFDPDSPQAGAIVHLGVVAGIILAAIFVIVAGAKGSRTRISLRETERLRSSGRRSRR